MAVTVNKKARETGPLRAMLGGCSTLPSGTDYYIKLWLNSQLVVLLCRRKRMRILTSDEVVYVLDVLKNEEENIDNVMIFLKVFLSELQEQEDLKNKDFKWLKLLIEKLSDTSNNLNAVRQLYKTQD